MPSDATEPQDRSIAEKYVMLVRTLGLLLDSDVSNLCFIGQKLRGHLQNYRHVKQNFRSRALLHMCEASGLAMNMEGEHQVFQPDQAKTISKIVHIVAMDCSFRELFPFTKEIQAHLRGMLPEDRVKVEQILSKYPAGASGSGQK